MSQVLHLVNEYPGILDLSAINDVQGKRVVLQPKGMNGSERECFTEVEDHPHVITFKNAGRVSIRHEGMVVEPPPAIPEPPPVATTPPEASESPPAPEPLPPPPIEAPPVEAADTPVPVMSEVSLSDEVSAKSDITPSSTPKSRRR